MQTVAEKCTRYCFHEVGFKKDVTKNIYFLIMCDQVVVDS